jgi:predicted MPP superfamily phosphohydrolase
MTMRSSFAALLPLGLWLGLGLLGIFHTHGGHRFAYAGANAACTDASRVPTAAGQAATEGSSDAPFVVLHATDLHVSDVDGSDGKKHVSAFMEGIVPRLRGIADVVAITGDLVNAKRYSPGPFKHVLGHFSEQSVAEWAWYNKTASSAAALLGDETLWITVPGNHDVFGTRRFYNEYCPAVQPILGGGAGSCADRVCSVRVRGHTIVAVDPTFLPSPHRPLNFFGDLTPTLAGRLEHAVRASDSGAVILLSHYPTAMLAGGRRIDDAVVPGGRGGPRSTVLLSGHLHTLRGLFPTGMQSISRTGRLELQLPDLFSSRAFRIFAVDRGLPSWTDYALSGANTDGPLAVVLNVPRAGLCSPGAGYAAAISSHMRVLVVADNVQAVRIHVEGVVLGEVRQSVGDVDHVYAIPWSSSSFRDDARTHVIDVYVDQGKSKSQHPCVSYPFALDGREVSGWQARWRRLGRSFFTLSDFERIALLSARFGLCSCLIICLVTLVFVPLSRRKAICMGLTTAWIAGGRPFLVASNLGDAGGVGFAPLNRLSGRDGVLHHPVDSSFTVFLVVLEAMLPAFYCTCAVGLFPGLASSPLIILVRCVACFRSISWTLTIAGAHGVFAACASPSCIPLTVLTIWCYLDSRRSSALVCSRSAFRKKKF